MMSGPSQARDWLAVHRGRAPLVVSFPHTGTEIPAAIEERLASSWLARKDTDWWVHRLYGFAGDLDATTIRTAISRTVIDVNRDPSGASLYPGRATTQLCPLTSFDGEPLYRAGCEPDAAEIDARRVEFFEPYHDALRVEIERLRTLHGAVVLYDAHSIRSRIPRLFAGMLPNLNIGTNDGRTCDPALAAAVERSLAGPIEYGPTEPSGRGGYTCVTDGRFKGGWTVRHHGRPTAGVHAMQMEMACRGYLEEPERLSPDNWPPDFDAERAEPLRAALEGALRACIDFVSRRARGAP